MKSFLTFIATMTVVLAGAAEVRAQGIFAPAAGPINTAMAGASTAAPVDFGSSYWNPAVLSGLNQNEVLLSSALAFPSTHLSSELPAGSIGGVLPATNRFGTSRSDSGVGSGLAVGTSFRLSPDSPITFGLGIFGLVGGNVNFAGSRTTPVLGPRQPPNFFGLGPIYANLSLLAIQPTVSVQMTDRLAVAAGPVITSGTVSFSPAFFAPGPRDAFGVPTFPAATNSRPFWGGGFQVGLFYELNDDWNLGFSYKSPIWQERWAYNASTPDLNARRIGVQAQIPQVFSWGVAYKGLPKTLIDVDLRYFDYPGAGLFGQSITSGGLDWKGVFAVAVGGQYRATDRLALMAGYLFNTNPINEPQTLFNVQAPAIVQDWLSVGASYRVNENLSLSLAWQHGFRNAISGPILQVPNSAIRLDSQLDIIQLGLTIQYGAKRGAGIAPAVAQASPDVTQP